MKAKLLGATDAARNFSAVLDHVHHHGTRYDIRRGREIVARIVPAGSAGRKITVAELEALLLRLPRLANGDAERFESDIAASRETLREARNPWA